MQSLRVGLVSPYSFLAHGGVQEHTKSLGRALSNLGHTVIYISPDKKDPRLPSPHLSLGPNLRVPTPNGSWAELSYSQHSAHKIKQLISKYNLHLLHFQELIAPLSSWSWLKHSTVPNIATYHAGWDKDQDSTLSPMINLLEPLIKPHLHQSLSSSSTSASCNVKLTVNNIVVPPAIEVTAISQAQPRPKEFSKLVKNVVFLGRFDERKGALHLLQAINHLSPKTLTQTRFHFVGSGPHQHQLEHLISLYKLDSSVVLHGSFSGAKKYSFLQHADLFIAPTTHGESFGMVLIEALAAGCPVIAGNNAAYKDTLKDYPFPEYILDPRNPKKLAHAIEDFLTHPQKSKTIQTWAKKFVTQFDAANVAQKHISIYEEVLARSRDGELQFDPQHQISYYQHGEAKNPTIIILHGHRSDSKRLLPLSLALSQNHHVITPDLPGSGHSPVINRPHTIDNLAQQIAHWLNSQKIKNYSICGLSMGGAVGVRMIKYLRQKPSHLYLYATPTDAKELTPSRIQSSILKLISHPTLRLKLAKSLAPKVISKNSIMRALYKLWFPHMDPITREYEITQWRAQSPQALVETIDDMVRNPLHNEHPQEIKTTYILAKHDNYINNKLVKKNIKKILPNTKFVAINLQTHVPKGPLTPEFFQPFLDTILQKKT